MLVISLKFISAHLLAQDLHLSLMRCDPHIKLVHEVRIDRKTYRCLKQCWIPGTANENNVVPHVCI